MTEPISFHDIVARNARERPDAVFVESIDPSKAMTYGDLGLVCGRIATHLAGMEVAANERVLLLAENAVEYHAIFVAVLRYGATIVTVNVDMNRAHMAEIVAAVNPRLVIYKPGLGLEVLARPGVPWVEIGEWSRGSTSGFFSLIEGAGDGANLASVARPDDHAVIFYTSGTVAKPKGVIQTHATAYYNYDATADYLGLSPGARVFDCRSLAWLSAQHMALGAPLVAGATAVIAAGFSASRYLGWLRDHDIDISFVVPTMVNMLLATPQSVTAADLPRLKFLTSSSAPLYPEPWLAFERTFGIRLCQSGGSSEGGNTAAHRGRERKIGTLGPPLKYQRVRIVDENGREMPDGELGEIILSGGKQQAFGYLMPDGTVERLPVDGHRTGDLGRLDEDGHLVIVGRIKEVIIRGGVKIAPLEIEAVLYEVVGVAEAAAIGVPDPIWGEEVVAFVAKSPEQPVSDEAVLAHARQRLPEFKVPKKLVNLPDLPKNARGKIDRAALVAIWNERHSAGWRDL